MTHPTPSHIAGKTGELVAELRAWAERIAPPHVNDTGRERVLAATDALDSMTRDLAEARKTEDWLRNEISRIRSIHLKPEASVAPSLEAIQSAIRETEYKYFGDYELSDEQWDAVITLINAGKHLAAERTSRESAERQRDAAMEALQDPVAVHRNMLAGSIAKPSLLNIAHLDPEVQQMREALIATLKHFRWPTSAEHETRDKVTAALAHFDDPPMIPPRNALAPREGDGK
jgi:hypothetical protein